MVARNSRDAVGTLTRASPRLCLSNGRAFRLPYRCRRAYRGRLGLRL